MYNVNDIEVFIITYNRIIFLPLALKSILDQSILVNKITIIDNGSIDGTSDYLKKINNPRIKIIINEVNISFNVFLQIKQLVSNKLVLLFHDDDILHFDYLKVALQYFNTFDKISTVLCLMEGTKEPVFTNWEMSNYNNHIYCHNQVELASLYYQNYPIPFSSNLYKTEHFLNAEMDFLTYGKIFDRPFVLNVIGDNGAILLKNNFVRIRIHPTQDSKSLTSGPYLKEILNLNHLYYNLLSDQLRKPSGRIFLKMNFFNLIRDYNWIKLKQNNISVFNFIKFTRNDYASSNKSLTIGFLLFPINLLERYKKYMQKK
jgi:glycosyltransferase involved in cell wall biosynthesis